MTNNQTEDQLTEFNALMSRYRGPAMAYFRMMARFNGEEMVSSKNLSQQFIDRLKLMVSSPDENQQELF